MGDKLTPVHAYEEVGDTRVRVSTCEQSHQLTLLIFIFEFLLSNRPLLRIPVMLFFLSKLFSSHVYCILMSFYFLHFFRLQATYEMVVRF